MAGVFWSVRKARKIVFMVSVYSYGFSLSRKNTLTPQGWAP
jgi:hypothetical protein